ncbi:NADH dehydrogenase [ubiquinone] 1 alpha subcomplex subunit 13 [Cherax quadricarinatus]|nr:NADH dehydrogenase [ubiquinone] 1 alpha subcomplex subunit 13-like [Cherax quadricarinatus]
MASSRTQDLPPREGYSPITYSRIPARTYFKGYQLFAGYAVVTAVAAYVYSLTDKKIRRNKLEMLSGVLALEPMLLAERDRQFLKQMRRNRDEEEKLMANVEGWEVGKLYNEPIFKTVPEDRYMDPIVDEYYIHGHQRNFIRNAYLHLFT